MADQEKFDISTLPLQDADALNHLMREEAKKQGIDLNQPRNDKGQFVKAEETKSAPVEKAKEQPKESPSSEEVVYKLEVEVAPGKSIFVTGSSEAEVNAKAEIAQKAVEAAIATAKAQEQQAKPEPKKAELTTDELFNIGVKLQSGKAEAIDEYLEKSGFIEKYFEKRGIKVSELQEQVNRDRSNREVSEWQRATDEFKKDHPDYVGTKRNQKMIGWTVAEIKMQDPSLSPKDAIEKAYSQCREDGLLDVEAPKTDTKPEEAKPEATAAPVTKEIVVPKKKATSSALFGTGAESDTRKVTPAQKTAGESLTAEQLKKMTPQEMADWYNWQVKVAQQQGRTSQ